jgi:hypothetical protein
MLDGILKNQIRGDPEIAGMLAKYKGSLDKEAFPAFFFQKAPQDDDRGWLKPTFPRADYNIDMSYDPERKAAGIMMIHVWCILESEFMPEDIEKRLIKLISGTFYTNKQCETVCAVWNRSDAFGYEMPANVGGNTAPEVIGIAITFDLLSFPEQISTDPDPIQGLNIFTRELFPDMMIINHDNLPSVFRPSDQHPAIYWRFEGTSTNIRQSYAVDWYQGSFAAHVIAESVTERNRWTKALIERIQLYGEILLVDESPMFANSISIRHSADPLREGQLLLTGQYGVLAQQRKEYLQPSLNKATMTGEPGKAPVLRMEVKTGVEEQ